jgi:hypothetical protein
VAAMLETLAAARRIDSRDSDLFGEGVRKTEAQRQTQAAFKPGFQSRDAEMSLGRLLGELADR